jgi:single-stranded DNA-binding protein
MFRFTLQGRVGRIEPVKGSAAVVRISLAADRLVEGKDGAWSKTEWLSVVSFDEPLNTMLLAGLKVGASALLEGRIEPRKRQIGEAKVSDHTFVLTRFEPLAKPATPAPSAPPPSSETAAKAA